MCTHNYHKQNIPWESITYRNKAVIFFAVMENEAYFVHLVS